MTGNTSFHYPADVMNLLVETIPLLNKGKMDTVIFFEGAGIPEHITNPWRNRVRIDRDSVSKREIVQDILVKINEQGDKYLGHRREVIKRVTTFDDFSVCWPSDQLKAQGLVAKIQQTVKVKDTVTKVANEVEKNIAQKRQQHEEEQRKQTLYRESIQKTKGELASLFAEKDPHKRGKRLERVLNDLFSLYGISIKEAFTLKGDSGEGIIEQIDGVIEFDSQIYFVEMKWWQEPLGVNEIAQHMMRIFMRAESRAIIISASDFTMPAVSTCKEALQQKVVVLATLQELVFLLEQEKNLQDFFRHKVRAAIVEKNPFATGMVGAI